jgi:uncharacterized membrane protein
MSYEPTFETTGAPDGEYREPHTLPTPTEAWAAYDKQAQPALADRILQGAGARVADWGSQMQQVVNWLGQMRVKDGAEIMQNEWTNKVLNDKTLNKTLNNEELKRWSALVGGSFLALFGLRRSLGSLTLMGFGAGLAYYALTGRSPLARLEEGFKEQRRMGSSLDSNGPIAVKSIIVKAPLSQVYEAWADFETFPRFMQYIRSVAKTGDRHSRWLMEGPLHMRLEWEAETTRQEENKRIAWSSTSGDIKTSGQVTFNALPDGQVEVTVVLKYVPPAGIAGDIFARFFNDPSALLETDLRNFKQFIEAQANAGNGNHHTKANGTTTNGKSASQKARQDKVTTAETKDVTSA